MSSFKCLGVIAPSIEFSSFQREGMARVFKERRMLLGFDTGLGKTLTYAGIARGLLNRDPTRKHVFLAIASSTEQVSSDLASLTEVNVNWFDGKYDSADRLRYAWNRISIAVVTLEAMANPAVVEFLFSKLPEIESFAIDEAHHVSHWQSSNTAFMVRAFARYIPYVVELSATPITRTSQQYYRLMNILDRQMSPRTGRHYGDKPVKRFMAVNRKTYGLKGKYVSRVIVVDPLPEQMIPQKGIVFKSIKGTGAVPQVKALVAHVRARVKQGLQIIVYLTYHDTREWVESNFRDADIDFVSLHGKITKREERQAILEKYRNGGCQVLITTLTESLNIEADVVMFYEFTAHAKQVIGRAHRGLESKVLEILVFLTRDTPEVDYFMKYIYKRSQTIQYLLGKDYSELIALGDEVKRLELEGS